MLKKAVSFLLLTIIFIASSYSLFNSKMFRVHDYIHAARIVEMSDALSQGQFPVRWTNDFGYGFGMPLFEFYAPLPTYFGTFIYYLSGNINWSVKSLFLFANLMTIWGAFLLGKKLFGYRGGLITAAALTLAPYRAVNLFVRGAISEAWGIMALPWILYYLVKVIKDKHNINNYLGLVLSLSVLALSHNLTTLMFFPLSFIFGLGYIVWLHGLQQKSLIKLLKILAIFLLAVGLASFYMIPAVLEKDLTQIESILSGYFHYSHHFLYIRQFFRSNWQYGGSAWGPDDNISFFLGYGQLLAFISVCLYLVKDGLMDLWQTLHGKNKNLFKMVTLWIKEHGFAIILMLLFTFSLFMSLLKSKFLWDSLPLLSFIQFPWRWMAPAIMFLSLLAGLLTKINHSKTLFFIFFVVMLFNLQFFKPEKYLENSQDFYYTDRLKIQRQMSDILPDYIPLDMDTKTIQSLAQDLDQDVILLNEGLESSTLVNRASEKLVDVNLTVPAELSFRVANYPGWKAEVDGQKAEYQQGELGNIIVSVDQGQHKVGLILERTNVRKIADIISLVSLIVLLWLMIDVKNRKIDSGSSPE